MNSIPQLFKEQNGTYDYALFWKYIHTGGIEKYGPKFILYEEDSLVLLKLLVYFLQDKKLAEHYEMDLNKGILLTGPVGCGKTSLMNLMRYLIEPSYRYRMKATREIAMAYADEGYQVIQRYTRLSFNPYTHKPITYCFDDLGLESPVQYYGNPCNTMAEILLSRYDHYTNNDMLTHLTSNLSAPEVEERYGTRVRSRMREQFNLIAFDNNSPDKRR